ncbi:hypothetical protein SAMN05216388_1001394 [Halorientalis persicus]|uniref:Uncharacterized protein n=1 Tax=Halorientalis persicus TaxID=1367881 RepID=A0A1H8DX67_9EURY|nr:hypothetical protein [Halorientalis persicus]SEN11157.1 hypothetical protein SAMN05216388_1001394 [Halorientalis persicus]
MRTDRLALVAVGLLVVLAGCSGSPGGSGTDPAGNGTDAPGSPVADGSATSPAGNASTGIENASALVAATDQRLATTDHAFTQTLEQQAGEESLTVTQRTRSSLTDERRLFVFDATSETNRIFVADGTQYLDAVADGETTTRRAPFEGSFEARHEPEMLGGGESLGGILRSGNYTAAGTVERDGRRLARFELVEADRSRISETVTDASGEVLVGSDGVVYDAALRIELESGYLNQTFRIERLGDVTVERPDWVDEIDETG